MFGDSVLKLNEPEMGQNRKEKHKFLVVSMHRFIGPSNI